MERYCGPVSQAPEAWKRNADGQWICLRCNRTGLLGRHRHLSRPSPIRIPVYGERGAARSEVVAHALVSPLHAHLAQYKWRMTVGGYVYRSSRMGGRREGNKSVNVYLHREVLGLEPGNPLEGHHRDDNPLNNTAGNLQRVTRSQNELYKRAKGIRLTTLPPL